MVYHSAIRKPSAFGTKHPHDFDALNRSTGGRSGILKAAPEQTTVSVGEPARTQGAVGGPRARVHATDTNWMQVRGGRHIQDFFCQMQGWMQR